MLSGFKPHIFEKCSTLGGLWRTVLNQGFWDSTNENLPKHTCSFSEVLSIENKDHFLKT